MVLDISKMRQIAEGLFSSKAASAFGPEGSQTLTQLFDAIIQLYARVNLEAKAAPFVAFLTLPSKRETAPELPNGALISGVSVISTEFDQARSVEVRANGSMVFRNDPLENIDQVSHHSIVYKFDNGSESVVIAGEWFDMINPSVGSHLSVFARPTYRSLDEALAHYKVKNAANSSCMILNEIWDDEHRYYLKNKPEATMRKSLNQYLNGVLQDAEVRPEQNVDETHPVDIKVSWTLTNHCAIIEIKWLGDSRNQEGAPGTSYRDARAQAGAQQLADYLNASHRWGPTMQARGYLVVYDARRGGITSYPPPSRDQAFEYQNREIAYDPDFSTSRPDFSPPNRFFLNPAV